jgi:DNA polymerase II small subunit/DNA polymerase delta subunit B
MGVFHMDSLKRISEVFKSAQEVIFDDSSRIVLMSDCHRGNGSFADEFLKNQNSYFAALMHYYNQKYIYIEIGDGDELCENRSMNEIINQHKNVFWILSRFYKDNRLYFIAKCVKPRGLAPEDVSTLITEGSIPSVIIFTEI